MFEVGKLYKHSNARDVALYPLDITEGDNGYYRVTAMWVNVHYHELGLREPFIISPKPEVHTLSAAKMKEFVEYNFDLNKGILRGK